MAELVFVGLGLHDEKGITLRGLEEARAADLVLAEFYTSALLGTRIEAVESLVGKPIRRLTREQVEGGGEVLEAAKDRRVAFLVAGDPMVATTHVDLRLRAAAAGISTRVIHGVSILGAAAGTLGLQAYKFGRTTTVPFPSPGLRVTSPLDPIVENRRAGLHTLVLLDLREDGTFLDPRDALGSLLGMAENTGNQEFGPRTVVCVLSRVGSPGVKVETGAVAELLKRDLGPPLHCLVVPGSLHFLEKEALVAFAGAPHDL
jgi:diphthine synthase